MEIDIPNIVDVIAFGDGFFFKYCSENVNNRYAVGFKSLKTGQIQYFNDVKDGELEYTLVWMRKLSDDSILLDDHDKRCVKIIKCYEEAFFVVKTLNGFNHTCRYNLLDSKKQSRPILYAYDKDVDGNPYPDRSKSSDFLLSLNGSMIEIEFFGFAPLYGYDLLPMENMFIEVKHYKNVSRWDFNEVNFKQIWTFLVEDWIYEGVYDSDFDYIKTVQAVKFQNCLAIKLNSGHVVLLNEQTGEYIHHYDYTFMPRSDRFTICFFHKLPFSEKHQALYHFMGYEFHLCKSVEPYLLDFSHLIEGLKKYDDCYYRGSIIHGNRVFATYGVNREKTFTVLIVIHLDEMELLVFQEIHAGYENSAMEPVGVIDDKLLLLDKDNKCAHLLDIDTLKIQN